jgi:Fe-S cluster assembly protein SufD
MTASVGEQNEFLAPFAELEQRLAGQGPDWLRRARRAALNRFGEIGFPTTRQEEWRTTNVAPIARTRFEPAAPSVESPAALPPLADVVPGALRLIFVDGNFDPARSTPLEGTDGVWAGSLARALETMPHRLEQHLTRRDPAGSAAFTALNTALAADGAVVLVDDGTVVERPVHVIYLATGNGRPRAAHPRTLIVAGGSSRVALIESYLSAGDGVYLTNAVTDVFVGENAEVRHDRLQIEGEAAFHVSTIESHQARNSRYNGLNLNLGGGLVRHDLLAGLDGEGARCELDGLYLTRGTQHLDNHTTIDHARPHCESREVYKGVLGGSSRATFNGRILVRPGAQQTDARQSNPNLLLSDSSLAHTRPQLEIYADDVKCTHGATVGRLDEDAIFYLRSRAISASAARDLLISAFAGEILQRVELEPLRLRLEQAVAERLPAMRG